jgi:serine/threonine protein phosphatase 1
MKKSWLSRLRLRPNLPTEYRVPEGERVYAVGDLHGRLDLLEKMLAAIAADAAGAQRRNSIVFLGDYVDRGPNSKGVIDRLIALDWPGWGKYFLRGNHDQAVLDFLADANSYRAWRDVGAAETLLSYGVYPPRFGTEDAFVAACVEFADKLPSAHRDFLDNLAYRHQAGDYYFAHAGVRPGIALDKQMPEDLLWIREDFLLFDGGLEKIIVHGHTPQEQPARRGCRIGVDTGAYASGRLSAVVLEAADYKFITVRDA